MAYGLKTFDAAGQVQLDSDSTMYNVTHMGQAVAYYETASPFVHNSAAVLVPNVTADCLLAISPASPTISAVNMRKYIKTANTLSFTLQRGRHTNIPLSDKNLILTVDYAVLSRAIFKNDYGLAVYDENGNLTFRATDKIFNIDALSIFGSTGWLDNTEQPIVQSKPKKLWTILNTLSPTALISIPFDTDQGKILGVSLTNTGETIIKKCQIDHNASGQPITSGYSSNYTIITGFID